MAENRVRVESVVLDDGRRAERHVVVADNGNEIVEVFAEEKRPLKLEKRIVREMKTVVAKETHQRVRDGDVIEQEIHSLEPEVPLQIRSHIAVVDHAKVVDGDYVRKDEVAAMIADGVVAGVNALLDHSEPAAAAVPAERPSARSLVEKHVEEKKKSDVATYAVMGVIIVAQLAVFGWLFLT